MVDLWQDQFFYKTGKDTKTERKQILGKKRGNICNYNRYFKNNNNFVWILACTNCLLKNTLEIIGGNQRPTSVENYKCIVVNCTEHVY